MQRDWSGQREVTEPRPLRRVITLAVSALILLYIGVWLGESRRPSTVKQSRLERPLTLGETRFVWTGSALAPLSDAPSILPPVEDPIIPIGVRLPSTPQAPTLIPPAKTDKTKLSLTQSLAPNPVDHNALKRERAERERVEREKAEREKLELEKAELEKAELEKLEREKAEREKAEREKAEREKAEREKLEREKAEREKAERERVEREKAERERVEREKAERERVEREKAERRDVTVRDAQKPDAQGASKGSFNLQVKAFRQRAEAIKFVRSISKRLGEYQDQVYIQSAESKGQPIYRVRVGPFTDEADADQARAEYMKRFGTQDAPFVSHR